MDLKTFYEDFDEKRNCHAYCRFRHVCKYKPGAVGLIPEDCGEYYILEDIEMEAREQDREERWYREHGWYDDEPREEDDEPEEEDEP